MAKIYGIDIFRNQGIITCPHCKKNPIVENIPHIYGNWELYCGFCRQKITFTNRKIDVLLLEGRRFIDNLHVEGVHWGGIHSFNSEVKAHVVPDHENELYTNKQLLINQVIGLNASGTTLLYDSLVASIERLCMLHFNANPSRRGIPMMIITFTDGNDEGSKLGIQNVRDTLKKWDFFPKNSCFFAIIGVGKSVNDEGLKKICDGGYGQYDHTNNINDIYQLFQNIVNRITNQVVINPVTQTVQIGGLVLQTQGLQYQQQNVIQMIPIDYILNLDVSGSMKD